MASAIIHMCVAKKVNEEFHLNPKLLYLGTIAPDLSKELGLGKENSHFLEKDSKLPNIQNFIEKYQEDITHPFELGYLIHLYTDYYWYQDFVPRYIENNKVSVEEEKELKLTEEEVRNLIYQDYNNLNITLIDAYELELSLFYEELETVETKITEIPIDRLNVIVDKMGQIISNSKKKKSMVFPAEEVKKFIDIVSSEIIKLMRGTK